ncbi:MAG: sn-glycerol-3-phosphate ABC transporter ATP-binding protein UgpC [Pseudomonadota bacterium]
MADVSLIGLEKSYSGGHAAVGGISLDISDREFVVIVGPSGCGKSTTLRLIAGIEAETAGDILIDGQRVNDLSPGARDVAMVFQDYALYPHMSVERNIGFGLRRRGMRRADVAQRVKEVAEILEIGPLLGRRPAALSGGQRQRVAMGRAMVRRPRVFLFDEPLSNLDARLRVSMRAEMRRLQAQMPTTTLYVTHDQTEAMTMADRVVVMNDGRVEQVGAPMDIYRRPANLFVARFIGSPAMNLFEATLSADGAELPGGARVPLPRAELEDQRGRRVMLGFRPEAVAPAETGLSARVETVEPIGQEIIVEFDTVAAGRLWSRLPPDSALRTGAQVRLGFDAGQAHIFDIDTGTALRRAA